MPPNLGQSKWEVFLKRTLCLQEPPQIIFQGDTSTQSERTRNPRLHEEKQIQHMGRNRSTQTSGIIIHRQVLKNFSTQDLKEDNSYSKQIINFFLKSIENLERNQTGLLDLSPATLQKNQPLISDTWPGNRRCYLIGKLVQQIGLSQRLGSFCHQEYWGKELPYEDT